MDSGASPLVHQRGGPGGDGRPAAQLYGPAPRTEAGVRPFLSRPHWLAEVLVFPIKRAMPSEGRREACLRPLPGSLLRGRLEGGSRLAGSGSPAALTSLGTARAFSRALEMQGPRHTWGDPNLRVSPRIPRAGPWGDSTIPASSPPPPTAAPGQRDAGSSHACHVRRTRKQRQPPNV